jgi:hypothetical protein
MNAEIAASASIEAAEPSDDAPAVMPRVWRKRYLTALTWTFTLFNSIRVLAYLPTLWALHRSGDSSQHSLLTWLIWLGANSTMALWLYEQHGQRWTRAALVNVGNAVMCGVIAVVIVALRWSLL